MQHQIKGYRLTVFGSSLLGIVCFTFAVWVWRDNSFVHWLMLSGWPDIERAFSSLSAGAETSLPAAYYLGSAEIAGTLLISGFAFLLAAIFILVAMKPRNIFEALQMTEAGEGSLHFPKALGKPMGKMLRNRGQQPGREGSQDKPTLVYSVQGDGIFYEVIGEALEAGGITPEIGEEYRLFLAEKQNWAASDFVPDIVSEMSEAAFEEADEWAEDWLWNMSDVEKSDLRAAIGKAVDNWADKHGRQPAFWTCHNIRPVMVRCTAHDRGKFVFVTDADTQGSTANAF
jgi:hypothetical protein